MFSLENKEEYELRDIRPHLFSWLCSARLDFLSGDLISVLAIVRLSEVEKSMWKVPLRWGWGSGLSSLDRRVELHNPGHNSTIGWSLLCKLDSNVTGRLCWAEGVLLLLGLYVAHEIQVFGDFAPLDLGYLCASHWMRWNWGPWLIADNHLVGLWLHTTAFAGLELEYPYYL